MSRGRYFDRCDFCGVRGPEYATTTLPCSGCGEDVCERCATEFDPDPPGRAVCQECRPMNPFKVARNHVRIALTLEALDARENETSAARWAILDAEVWERTEEPRLQQVYRMAIEDLEAADRAFRARMPEAADALLREVERNLGTCFRLDLARQMEPVK